MNSIEKFVNIKPLNKANTVMLVKDSTGRFLVRKNLKVYDASVYEYLRQNKPKGIPQIISYEIKDDELVILEEYIEGRTLAEVLAEEGPLSKEYAKSIMVEICNILEPLHSAYPSIVHRDIKPSNIMISNSGDVYLLDFNAATQYLENKDYDTVLIGTTGYAAPEQYGFKASNPQADIYAIGRVAQDIFTGERVLPENYDGPYKKVVQKCLKLDPKDRYENVASLKKALLSDGRLALKHKWYLLPGYRTSNPLIKIGATFFYIIALLMFTPSLDGRKAIETAADAIAFIFLVVEFLFAFNYMNVHKYLPLTSSPKLWVRICGTLIYMSLIYLIVSLLVGILNDFGLVDFS